MLKCSVSQGSIILDSPLLDREGINISNVVYPTETPRRRVIILSNLSTEDMRSIQAAIDSHLKVGACKWCESEFVKTRERQIYCSSTCRSADGMKRHRESHKSESRPAA